jgi:hypothetical protein
VAIKPVEMIAPVDTQQKKSRKGGGGIGQAIGGVVGGVAGGVAGIPGGPAAIAGGAIAGTAAGASVGGMIGERIKPTREGSSTAMQRRVMGTPQMMQSERTQKLRESILALHQQPPEVQQQYAPTLVQGYLKSLADDGVA